MPSTNEHTLLWDALLESLSLAVNIAVLVKTKERERGDDGKKKAILLRIGFYFSGGSVS